MRAGLTGLRPLGRIQERLSETTVGAQSLGPFVSVTLSRRFSFLTEMVQEVIMVPQLQPPAAPIHMDPVQALGITLHKPSKKIHYVLCAVVLRTEFLAEFGDSSDLQRASRPQRTVYSKGRQQRVTVLGLDGPEPSARRVKHKTLLKTDPSGAVPTLLDPFLSCHTCLPSFIRPTVFGIGAISRQH